MRRDYAGVVSKLVLLMGAGAAVRTAWEMIVKDYQAKKEKGQVKTGMYMRRCAGLS